MNVCVNCGKPTESNTCSIICTCRYHSKKLKNKKYISIPETERLAREAGMSYGEFVLANKL